MNSIKKRIVSFIAVFVLVLSGTVGVSSVNVQADETSKGIVILHTNDVHCGVDNGNPEGTLGIAELAGYRQKLEDEGYETILVDAGDFIQGDILGTISKGEYPAEIMQAMNYDIAVPGNHEYDYGMDTFLNIVAKSNAKYLSCNFMDLRENKPVFEDSYKIIEKDGIKIGFVGVTTPKTLTSSTPAYFKDENGNWIYGFSQGNEGQDLYDRVQEAVDAAKTAGAQIVVAVGHMGIGEDLGQWTSDKLIAATDGIDVFIDGHSHSVVTGTTIANKDGKNVILAQTGTKLANIGTVTIDSSENINASMVSSSDYTVTEDVNSNEYKEYQRINGVVTEIEKQNEELLSKVVARSDVNLYSYDPQTGDRLIRTQETNLGDFTADAYRIVSGADIGFMNGGGIRADFKTGDLTYKDIISVNPYGNMLCVTEITGQQVLDALEWGVSALPSEAGRFLHASGITYEVHTYVPSSVKTNEQGEFVSVDGEYRVKNVKVGGAALDVNKTYKVASHNYYLKKGGDGFTMLTNGNLIQDEVMIDNQVLIEYITNNLGGTIDKQYEGVNGQGRIHVVAEKPTEAPTTEAPTTEAPTTVAPTTIPTEQPTTAIESSSSVTTAQYTTSVNTPSNDGGKGTGSAATGDENGYVIYMAAILLSLSVAGMTIYKKEKH